MQLKCAASGLQLYHVWGLLVANTQTDWKPLSVSMSTVIILSTLLLVFALVIILLAIVIIQQRKKGKAQPTAIPRLLERRAASGNGYDPKKRPKSTNLEFLHSTTENRYNNGNADAECFKPLVETSHHGNEYIQC